MLLLLIGAPAPEGKAVVSKIKRCLLHHPVPRDWYLSHCGALVAAWNVGHQRLGQQLFSALCRTQDGDSGSAGSGRFRLGSRRSEWCRAFESRNCVLGNLQLQTHRHRIAKRDERDEEV